MTLKLTEEQIQNIILEETKTILLEDQSAIDKAITNIKLEDYAKNYFPFFINTRTQFDYWDVIEDVWVPYFKNNPRIKARQFLSSKESKSPELEKWLETTSSGAGTDSFNEQIMLWYRHGGFSGTATEFLRFIGAESPRDFRDKVRKVSIYKEVEGFTVLIFINKLVRDVQSLIKAVAGPEKGEVDETSAYPTGEVNRRGLVQFKYNDKDAFAFKEGNEYRITNKSNINFVFKDSKFQPIPMDSRGYTYNELRTKFLETYPAIVYSGQDEYERTFDNRYKGPTNVPGAEKKFFTLEPDSSLEESRSLTEAMVLKPEGTGEAITVTSSPGGGPIPSRGVAKTPTAAAGAPRKGVIYLRGPRNEIAKLQKTIKQMDPSIDLGKTGPNKDGVDGLFGSLTLIAWRKLTNSKSTPANIQQAFDALEAAKSGQPASKAQTKQVDKFADDKILYRKDLVAQAKEAYDAAQERIQTLKTRKESAKNAIASLDAERKKLLAKANASKKQKEKRELFAQAGAFLRIDNGIRSGSIADKEAEIKELDTLLQQTTDLVTSELWPNLEAARKELENLGINYRELSETVTLSEAQLQQIILEETNFVLKKKLNEAPAAASAVGSMGAKVKAAVSGLGSMGAKGSKAAKVGSAITSTGEGVADVGRLMGKPGQKAAGLFKLLGFGALSRLVATFFSWPVMVGWQVWDEFVSPFTIEAERGDITKSYKQMAESQEASRMRENIDKAAGDFLIKVQEYVKGYEGFSFLGLILDLTGGPLNLISNFNTDIVGYITSKFTDNPVSAAIKKRRVEASRQFYKILQEYGPEIQSEGNIIPNSPQKVQELEQVLNAKISEFLKKEYDVLATTDMVDLIGRSIPTRSKAEQDLKAAAKPLVRACLGYYKFIGGAEASQGKEAGPTGAKDTKSATTAAGAAAARKVTPKPASYTGRISELTQKVVDLLKSNGVKDRDQQDAWISWTKQTMKNDKTARDETILSVIEEWLGFTSERVMRENRDLMEGIGLVLPERGEYEFSDFKEWLGDNNKEIGMPRNYGLYNPRHLRRYLNYVRKFKSNQARAKRQDKRSQRISKKIEKNREQIISLQSDLEKLGNSKKDRKKAERLGNKIDRLTGAAERKEKRAKKVKLRKRNLREDNDIKLEIKSMKITTKELNRIILQEIKAVTEASSWLKGRDVGALVGRPGATLGDLTDDEREILRSKEMAHTAMNMDAGFDYDDADSIEFEDGVEVLQKEANKLAKKIAFMYMQYEDLTKEHTRLRGEYKYTKRPRKRKEIKAKLDDIVKQMKAKKNMINKAWSKSVELPNTDYVAKVNDALQKPGSREYSALMAQVRNHETV